MRRYVLFQMAALLSLQAPSAHGQARTGSGTWGFVTARYDTRSPASIYTGYGWRGAFAMAGVLHNPRSGYSEMLGGVGAVFWTGKGANHWLAVATARTDNASSLAQIYWLPTVRTGIVTTRGNVKWTIPDEPAAPQKLSISPMSVTLPVWRRVAGGVAMDLSAAEGARPNVSNGLELRLRLPHAALGANAMRDVTSDGSRMRCFFSSMF